MGFRACLIFVCLAWGEPDEAPPSPPTLDQVVSRLERTEALIKNLSVSTKYVRLEKSLLPESVRDPVRLELATDFIVDSEGRFWSDCQGEQLSLGPRPGQPPVRVYKGCWRYAFDGKEATTLTGGADGEFHFGGIDDYPSAYGVNPLEYTTRYSQKPITKTLRAEGGRVVGTEERLSRPVVVVELAAVTRGGIDWNQRFWVDMERGVVVRRASLMRRNPEQGWREYARIESSDYREIVPGVWLPSRILYESVSPPKDGGPDELAWRFEGVNSDWRVNRALPADQFRLAFPAGLEIDDHRKVRPAESE